MASSLDFGCRLREGTTRSVARIGADSRPAFRDGQIGGTRVLFSDLQGKPTTMVYRPLGPGNARYVFESPVRKSIFAHVAEVPGSGFTVQPGTGSYTLAASIPWSALAVQPRTGATLRGDLGLLLGDGTGANTAQRVHWVDRETNVVTALLKTRSRPNNVKSRGW